MAASPSALPIFRPAGAPQMIPNGSGSSNQFFPTMPSMPSPGGGMPSGGGSQGPSAPIDFSQFNWSGGAKNPPTMWGVYNNKPSGVATEPLQYAGVGANLANFLQSQIGQGTPANPMLMQLMQFLSGGQSSSPGANTLGTIANNGISALPEWQQMIGAQQQNIQQNQANLREQFAGMGNLAGSPFGTAMSDYMSQTTADQNSLLGQLQQQNILQGQIPASEFLQNQMGQMSMFGQSLLPQNNPLLSLMSQMSSQYAPMYQTKQGGGMLGGLLPSLAGGAGAGIAAGVGGGGASDVIMAILAGMCDVAASFWGWDDPRTKRVQWWMITQADPDVALFYFLNGKRIAQTPHRWKFKPLFDSIVGGA
jgi:hypothetical protein